MALKFFKKEEKAHEVKKEKTADEKKAEEKNITVKPPKGKRIDLAWRVLKNAHITEKATDLTGENRYVFNIHSGANKNQVKSAVENIYGVDVVSVNVVNIPPKKRRVGKTRGWKAGYRKAIVEIKEGQKIELMPR